MLERLRLSTLVKDVENGGDIDVLLAAEAEATIDAIKADALDISNKQQATIADLQGRLEAAQNKQTALEKSVRNLTEFYDKYNGTPCEQIRHQQEVEQLQQRVAQLEQDSKKASTDYEACRNALDKTVGELTTLQADHATLLGLLATIAPYVASWLQETYGDDYVNHPEWKQVEASLPAPPAQDGGK